ncbi:hypothetical protein Hokovirus_3_72 [Hokovirus HKV1]|uniref:Uncharacterized protein n=1 Tax=Hokovirus HKV1 TaxID=1977638 RepID=A0A1V0SGE6_9VIRU|nr:hypothetical protein Hokovirus_3_72 [Hokovirus HKV1]
MQELAQELFVDNVCQKNDNLFNCYLIDNSGSTDSNINNNENILKYMCNYVKQRDTNFYLQFWNSEARNIGLTNNIMIDSHYANNLPRGGTNLSCSLKIIPDDWLIDNIYILTDGQIDRENDLINYFKNVTDKYNNINIITFDYNNYNYNDNNNNITPGSSIFEFVRSNNLTNIIREFACHNKFHDYNNPFINFSNPILMEGMIQFFDKVFPINKLPMFMKYIRLYINTISDVDTYNKLLYQMPKLLFNITKTLQPHHKNQIIDMFAEMLSSRQFDKKNEILALLINGVYNVSNNSELTFIEFRKGKKELFKKISDDLKANAKVCLGNNNKSRYVSLLLKNDNNIIVSGNKDSLNESYKFNHEIYINSMTKINNILIPSLPLDIAICQEQAVRQYVRLIYSHMYNVSILDDSIIYLVMTDNLRVQLSNLPNNIKKFYITLCTIMLNRTRVQEDNITELEHLKKGNPLLINRIFKHLEYGNEDVLKLCMTQINVNMRCYSFWYFLVLAYNNPTLINNQLVYCKQDLEQDFGLINVTLEDFKKILSVDVNLIEFQTENILENLEYICFISLDDTSKTGGWHIMPHESNNSICSPKYVISSDYLEDFLTNSNKCPLCYTTITQDLLESVKEESYYLNNNDNNKNEMIFDTNKIFNDNISQINYNASDKLLPFDTYCFNNNQVLNIQDTLITNNKNNNKKMVVRNNDHFNKILNDLFPVINNLNPDNLYLMGGAINSILLGEIPNDFDLFLVGIDNNIIFLNRVQEIVDTIKEYYKDYVYMTLYKTNNNVFELLIIENEDNMPTFNDLPTFDDLQKNPNNYKIHIKIQIVLTKISSVDNLIASNDIWATDMIYSFKEKTVFLTEKSYLAMKYMLIPVIGNSLSDDINSRLFKYFNKGFSLLLLNFDITNKNYVKNELLQITITKKINNINYATMDMFKHGKHRYCSNSLYNSISSKTIGSTITYINASNLEEQVIFYSIDKDIKNINLFDNIDNNINDNNKKSQNIQVDIIITDKINQNMDVQTWYSSFNLN